MIGSYVYDKELSFPRKVGNFLTVWVSVGISMTVLGAVCCIL